MVLLAIRYHLAIGMHFFTIIPFFFALSLSLMSVGSECANMDLNSTLATFGPSIEQQLTTSISESQPFSTPSIVEWSWTFAIPVTSAEQSSTATTFGTSSDQASMSSSGMATQHITTTQPASPTPSLEANGSSTIEAIIEIRISDFVGTATVNLTKTNSSSTSFNMRTSPTSILATTTGEGPSTVIIPSSSYNSSNTSSPLSNWTIGYNSTNGSFTNTLSPSSGLTIFTGEGTLHKHIRMVGIFPVVLFHIAVISLA